MTPIGNARRLRREATEAERRLWAVLRDKRLAGYRFRRQHPVGGFIVDFACTRHRLVVEANGSQHTDAASDASRTAFLQKQGWRVLRLWNNDILSRTEAVIETILQALQGAGPHPVAGDSRNAGEGHSDGVS
jgi:very-short-patch-repair endonuclease